MSEFMGIEFPTHAAMVEAIAVEWITQAGRRQLDSDEVRQALRTSSPEILASECIEEFHLQGHMQVEGYTHADLAAAFARLRPLRLVP